MQIQPTEPERWRRGWSRRLCGGTAILTLLCVASSGGQPGYQSRTVYERPAPATAPAEGRVAASIEALSNDAPEIRRMARQALRAMCPDIRAQLQWALDRAHEQVPPADRLQNGTVAAFHPELAELTVLIDRCDDARRMVPSTITLRYADAPLLDLLRDFGEQADAHITISSWPYGGFESWPGDARGSLDLNRVDYWSALREIRQSLGVYSTYGGSGVTFYRRTPGAPGLPLDTPHAVASGPLWIAPSGAARDGSGGIVLSLDVAAEPRVRAGHYVMVTVEDYTDDGGRPLLRNGPETTSAFVQSADGLGASRVLVRLPAPAAGRGIGLLRGLVGVSIGPPGLDLAIADLTRPEQRSFEWDDIVVTVISVTEDGTRSVVFGELSMPVGSPLTQAIVDSSGGTGFAQEWGYVHLDRLGLLDSSRRVIRRTMELGQARRIGEREVIGWTLTTTDPGFSAAQRQATNTCFAPCVPRTLTWSLPANNTRWLTVPFELRNVAVLD